jgi:hypothetical protein
MFFHRSVGVTMRTVSKDEAEMIATNKMAGTLFCHGGEPLPISEVEFQGSDEAPFMVDDVIQVAWGVERSPTSFERRLTTIGISLTELRDWCAEHYGCGGSEIKFWFES